MDSFKHNLTPQTINFTEKSSDIRIAHLAFKCVMKGVLFIWYRSRAKGFEEADGEVRTGCLPPTHLTLLRLLLSLDKQLNNSFLYVNCE
jgi:hypothetical protein